MACAFKPKCGRVRDTAGRGKMCGSSSGSNGRTRYDNKEVEVWCCGRGVRRGSRRGGCDACDACAVQVRVRRAGEGRCSQSKQCSAVQYSGDSNECGSASTRSSVRV